MYLPESVLFCIRRLNEAGYAAYAVGGCVRDALLGLTPQDYDLCTSALPGEISRVFADLPQVHNGEKHGTVAVLLEGQMYEITTFRKEGGYSDSRHPDWVEFVTGIREDLARRDFTVNAMAYAPDQGLLDPFGGQKDLEKKILRAVGTPEKRFSEDALRILRGVRFAVRFGLTPEIHTMDAMEDKAYLMENLAEERIFDELCKLLPMVKARDLLRFAPILAAAIPEISPCLGFDQRSPHHKFDVFTHIAYVVEHSPRSLPSRWAALLHDIGKPATFTTDETGRGHFYGHAQASAKMADEILLRLKAPTKLREQVVFLVSHHMVDWDLSKAMLRRRLGKYGRDWVEALLALQDADFCSKGVFTDETILPQVHRLLEEVLAEEACFTLRDLAVNGQDLMDIGFAPGKALGACLSWLLNQVINDKLPNDRQTLLTKAAEYRIKTNA